MNKNIKLKIFITVLAFILCFPLHFIYEKIPCFLISVIAPVNESIAEHMKLLFTSIIVAGTIEKIIVKRKQLDINNVLFSNFVAALTSIPIFLVMFIPVYSLIGENLPVNIILMLIAIIISEFISYTITKKNNLNLEKKTIIYIIIIYIIFTVLTYLPPKIEFFRDPINNYYGIKKQ